MTESLFSSLFLSTLALVTMVRVWLGIRHIRHIRRNRVQVPPAFAAMISKADHEKAADYTIAKTELNLLDVALGAGWVTLLTLGGGLQWLHDACGTLLEPGGYAHSLAFVGGLALASTLLDLPFAAYRTFAVETRFGFNRMSPRLFMADLLREALLAVILGAPLLMGVLWLMAHMGGKWWLYVWGVWLATNLLILLIYPSFIAPLFNKFAPMGDLALKERIERLLERCGFRSSGLFVMDGSRRSAHGNAYFTGFGKNKRIVFFDTLLERLSPDEIEAVLAHELGHFNHHHVWKRVVLMGSVSFVLLALLGYLSQQVWFFRGLGMESSGTAVSLVLFTLVAPLILFGLTPISSLVSRKHEFEADRYAAEQTQGSDLVSALLKLYKDNASTLTPDPLHSAFYDSHPSAAQRIMALQRTGAST